MKITKHVAKIPVIMTRACSKDKIGFSFFYHLILLVDSKINLTFLKIDKISNLNTKAISINTVKSICF
jgi:hypothetical protein